jgi:hypothetical protein
MIDTENKLVDLITQTDYLHAHLGTTPDDHTLEPIYANTLANAIIHRNIICARIDDTLDLTYQMILREKLDYIPVVLEQCVGEAYEVGRRHDVD